MLKKRSLETRLFSVSLERKDIPLKEHEWQDNMLLLCLDFEECVTFSFSFFPFFTP